MLQSTSNKEQQDVFQRINCVFLSYFHQGSHHLSRKIYGTEFNPSHNSRIAKYNWLLIFSNMKQGLLYIIFGMRTIRMGNSKLERKVKFTKYYSLRVGIGQVSWMHIFARIAVLAKTLIHIKKKNNKVKNLTLSSNQPCK